jgi:hypothetical protein
MFSAEDSLRSITQRISSQFLDKAYYELDPDEKEFASTWINQHFTFIKTEDITTLDQIMSLTEGLIRQKGIRVLVIDPWNKIENERLALGMDAIEYLAWGLNKLSRFAKKYMLAVVIVAHPPMLKSANGHIREVQSYYDINGGAQWGNIGDIISASNPVVGGKPMGLGYLPSKFSVFKVRERPELGDIGEVELCFNPKTKRFISKDEFYQLQYEHVHRDTEAAKANSTNTTPISESSSNHEIEVTTKVTIFDDPNIEEGVIE